jgi:hypothetical protein
MKRVILIVTGSLCLGAATLFAQEPRTKMEKQTQRTDTTHVTEPQQNNKITQKSGDDQYKSNEAGQGSTTSQSATTTTNQERRARMKIRATERTLLSVGRTRLRERIIRWGRVLHQELIRTWALVRVAEQQAEIQQCHLTAVASLKPADHQGQLKQAP